MPITPVLLCGGSGTRLWPLSRKSYPKQFASILGGETLFQASARRLGGFESPVIITASDFRFIVVEQLAAVGIDPATVLIEPEGRNTAPAVLAAALHLHAEDPDAMMLVCPSDHMIPGDAEFCAAVEAGVPAAESGQLVTFGIQPSYPETGYGYLELEAPATDAPAALVRFVEKPNAETAAELVASGRHMWNAGIFLFRASDIIDAFKAHAPNLVAPVTDAVANAIPDLGFLRLAVEPWSKVEDISVDYAVMERASNLSVVPYSGAWSDLGGWDAVLRASNRDSDGTATSGNATAIDCSETLLRSEHDGLELVGIGLENVIAVAMPDAVLVADASRAQDVKGAVAKLKARGAGQAEHFPKDHRPWGWFESLVIGDRFQVKRIVVHPGASLSLQSHHHRAEHWIVVEGTARVTVDDSVTLVTENESVYIPLGAKHRMENPGQVPMVLIEVQTGTYLGEDDIIRYEDVYARGQGAKG
ncbi:mannose-1-phosphate guanylyltransferase/mannose-6-phosphate isomerase [Tateyamaria omphalii]|uniref:mannose-1-phosphate guanylyltransferase/mannose-6-phosphate isomerase n=1 Tax=Tateyamaria omphalii TaxID=299262 RepID=UPI001673A2DB|nr:mannose-1-phosphate guanylyltransferase/mannose-6-phosphate isomerase [Tateyamaria omphalii]GGX70222.1 mannose-1-phosphate guanylyltransferase/mannose-6-phosphate isomerase [Tateyamaria omphalii]